jgi:hypothetical protein
VKLLVHLSVAVVLFGGWGGAAGAQTQEHTPLPAEASAGSGLHRTRLYLTDGSYQVVLNYRVQGKNVVYRSAERAGAEESIPLKYVDLDATHLWEKRKAAAAAGEKVVELDPVLVRVEAERTARSPEVAKDLHLPDEDSVLALDTFQGQAQLAILQQTDGELNRQTAHNVVRAVVNPLSTSHQLVELKGERSAVQLHVPDPVLYLRLDDDTGGAADEPPAGALQVDTHGAKGPSQPKVSGASRYAIVRVDVRRGSRVVTSFSINMLGEQKRQADVVNTTTATLPGGHWMSISPSEPLTFGEYALMEVLDSKNVNLGVWDFGVHPTAGPNRDAIVPEARKAPTLERRKNSSPD